jgi:protein gp37
VSAGCDNCYAERLTERFHGPGSFATVRLHEDRLSLPERWRKPRLVFVNSMSDLFHDDVPDEFIARVFGVMSRTPQHTFQILTKRHARMRAWMNYPGRAHGLRVTDRWPLPNVWLGVSVEDQKWADIRIRSLVDTPAAVRFLSCEPLLGPVDLSAWMPPGFTRWRCQSCLRFYSGPLQETCPGCGRVRYWCGSHTGNGRPGGQPLGWVIAGGESGPGARPMDPAWARGIRDQCAVAGVPFFFKQAGAVLAREWGCSDRKGHNPAEWSEVFPREFPDAA